MARTSETDSGPVTSAEVRAARFGTPSVGLRGYDQGEVDDFLDRAARALDGTGVMASTDVREARFREPGIGERGYDERQVDEMLDRIEQGLDVLAFGRAAAPEDDAVVDLAHQMFDLARDGATGKLAGYLDSGVPVDLTDAKGDTLVMLAAYNGHAGTVRALTMRHADVNRLNDRQQSPLAGAVFKGENDVIEALLEAGADPRAGSPSAVETARFFGKDDLAQRLDAR